MGKRTPAQHAAQLLDRKTRDMRAEFAVSPGRTDPARMRVFLQELLHEQAELEWQRGNRRLSKMWRHAAVQAGEGNIMPMRHLERLNRVPVTMEEFLDEPEYLGAIEEEIYPAVRKDILRINPDIFIGEEPIHEALLGGAIGIGKTTIMRLTTMYQSYLFHCFDDPPKLYRSSGTTGMLWPLQASVKKVAIRTLYEPLRRALDKMPHARRWMPYNKELTTEIQFANQLVIAPTTASLDGTIGSMVVGACGDEINFWQVIEGSKRAGAGEERFDQAEFIHKNLLSRRESRMMTTGFSMGCLLFASSTKYKGEFLERRINRARLTGKRNFFATTHRQFDVLPHEGRFRGKKFRLLVGTESWPTRVLEPFERPGEHFPPQAQVVEVPDEYRQGFLENPEGKLRDVIGISTGAIAPFIAKTDTIVAAVKAGQDYIHEGVAMPLVPWVDDDVVVLEERNGRMPEPRIENLPPPALRNIPHHVHVDLSIKGDRCGIAFARLDGTVTIEKSPGVWQQSPRVVIPLVVGLKPSRLHNVDFAAVRSWILAWSRQYGINVASVSYDGYQSEDSIQQMRRAGMPCWVKSVDRTMEPYNELRAALYEGRVAMVDCDLLRHELSTLEHQKSRDKVDHPATSSKDLADAVCGAFYGITHNREARAATGVAYADAEGNPIRPNPTRPRPPPGQHAPSCRGIGATEG